MSSLWGSKNTDEHEAQTQTSNAGTQAQSSNQTLRVVSEDTMREPTERDRLLPADHRRAPHADGYLDPDDPAVSHNT